MAPRWRLAAPHYLNVEGTTWEYKEIDRTTGRQKLVKFPVPLHLDPDQPADWSHKHGNDIGEIIVAYSGTDDPKDIVFTGPPTPDMVPLNDEAKKISAEFASKWRHPIESLSGTYADELLKELDKQVAEARNKANTVQLEGMAELLTALTEVMKQNQTIIENIVAQKPAPAVNSRRL